MVPRALHGGAHPAAWLERLAGRQPKDAPGVPLAGGRGDGGGGGPFRAGPDQRHPPYAFRGGARRIPAAVRESGGGPAPDADLGAGESARRRTRGRDGNREQLLQIAGPPFLLGGPKLDDSAANVFAEIEAERKADFGRAVDLEAGT